MRRPAQRRGAEDAERRGRPGQCARPAARMQRRRRQLTHPGEGGPIGARPAARVQPWGRQLTRLPPARAARAARAACCMCAAPAPSADVAAPGEGAASGMCILLPACSAGAASGRPRWAVGGRAPRREARAGMVWTCMVAPAGSGIGLTRRALVQHVHFRRRQRVIVFVEVCLLHRPAKQLAGLCVCGSKL